MATMHDVPRPVNPDFGPDPSDADQAWWAEHAPGNATDYDVEGPDVEDDPAYLAWLDARAAESARMDRLEGLIPVDVAESIARTSLVGLADEMIDAYADEAERVAGRRPSRDEAGRNVSLAWFRHGVNPRA